MAHFTPDQWEAGLAALRTIDAAAILDCGATDYFYRYTDPRNGELTTVTGPGVAFLLAEKLAPTKGLQSINEAQRLYVQEAGEGFTCLGFDVAETRIIQTLSWLADNRQALPAFTATGHAAAGTAERFAQYRTTMAAGESFNARTGARSPANLTPQLNGLEGKRVEVVDREGERRRFIVGKSTGWAPCHLEIERRNSSGGGAVWGAPFQSVTVIGER